MLSMLLMFGSSCKQCFTDPGRVDPGPTNEIFKNWIFIPDLTFKKMRIWISNSKKVRVYQF